MRMLLCVSLKNPPPLPQFTVAVEGRRTPDVNIFLQFFRNMTAIQTTPSDLERKKKTTQVKQSHEWHTFEFTLRGVAKTAQGRRGGGGREKREWKRERHYSAEQRQVEDYRWLALCRGAWACFQAHFSVIFSLYPRARSPRRVRMRHGAMWWMKRGRPKRYGHAGSKKTWPASWRGDW